MKEDQIFRDKLYHHRPPVREGLWEAIEAQLPPKKEERIFPVFWFTLFAATLLGGALMIGVFTNHTIPDATPKEKELIANPSVSSHQDTPSSTTLNESTASSASNSSESITASSLDAASAPKSSSIANQHSTSVNPTLRNKNLPGSTSAPTTSTSKNITLNTSRQPVSNAAAKQEASASLAVSASTSLGPVSVKKQYVTSFIPTLESGLSEDELSELSMSSLSPDPNCYKFGSIGSDFAFTADVFAGPGYSPKTFEENSSESSVYADARKGTESNQYAWSAGARLNLHHRSGFAARLGLTYSQAGDIFDYTDSLATQSTTRIDSFFAADGTFLYAETSQVLVLGTLIKKIHNTYRNLDIPLIIGYEMPMGRTTVMANAGAVFNLTSSHEGEILDPMLHPRSITEGDAGYIDVYKTSLGIGIYLGAGVLFPLTDHLSGLIEPSFLYRLKPVTLSSYPLQEHRHMASLNLGLRYHFN